MSAATLPAPAPAAPSARRPTYIEAATAMLQGIDAGRTVLLDGVTWDEYVWFDLRRDESGSGVRLNYADGRLELMTTSFFHDDSSERLHAVIVGLGVGLGVPFRTARRTTFRRGDVERAFEADESYYIQNVAAVRGLREIDLVRHPPPDLIIEVDVTRSSLPKQPIYAALGVPEVWRFDGTAVTFLVLRPGAGYHPQPFSRAFPLVNSADVTRLIQADAADDTEHHLAVQTWVRTLVPPPQP